MKKKTKTKRKPNKKTKNKELKNAIVKVAEKKGDGDIIKAMIASGKLIISY